MLGSTKATSLYDCTGLGLLRSLTPSTLARIGRDESVPPGSAPNADPDMSLENLHAGPSIQLEVDWDERDSPTEIFAPQLAAPPPDPRSTRSGLGFPYGAPERATIRPPAPPAPPPGPTRSRVTSGFQVRGSEPGGTVPEVKVPPAPRVPSETVPRPRLSYDDSQDVAALAGRGFRKPGPRARSLLTRFGWLALGAVGGYLIAGPSTSSVTLETMPLDAQVRIDGQLIAGLSPYAREGLLHGSHTLVVTHDGYRDHRETFTIAAGDAGQLAAVKLDRLPAPTPAPKAEATREPAAAPAAPQHSLVVSLPEAGRSAKDPYTIRLELRGLVPGQTGAPVLTAGSARKQGSPDDEDTRSKRLERCELIWQQSLVAEGGQPGQPAPKASAAARASASEAFKQAERCRWVWKRGADDPNTEIATGTLRVNSRPWSQVFVDDELIGTTPQAGIAVKPGTHTVELINNEQKLTKSFTLFIPRARIVTRVERLLD